MSFVQEVLRALLLASMNRRRVVMLLYKTFDQINLYPGVKRRVQD